MVRFIYSKWEGSQDFDLDTEQIMDELGKQIFRYGDLSPALRALQRYGFRSQNREMPNLSNKHEIIG